MKGLLLALSIMAVTAQADNIEVSWNHFADNGSFFLSSNLSHLSNGNLPPDGKQTVNNCRVANLPAKNEFIVSCNNKVWAFSASRFSCNIGGGGRWTSPDGSAGAYFCH